MLARILLLGCVFITHYGYASMLKETRHSAENRVMSMRVHPFTAVNLSGRINAQLHTGYAKPSLVLSGAQRDLDNVKVDVVLGVLRISFKNPKQSTGRITAQIRSRYLNGLVYHGSGTIIGTHLRANLERAVIDNDGDTTLKGTIRLGYLEVKGNGYTHMTGVVSPKLDVNLSEDAKLRLTGVASLRHLEMKDHSWFSLSWVKTPSLILCASGKAYVELGGIANKLDVQLWDGAHFNGRYLRARRAFVKTHDSSVAHMSATHHQHTLATDASDIRFYNLPEMKTDFMAVDGAVLDMRAFNTAFVEEQTPYNNP